MFALSIHGRGVRRRSWGGEKRTSGEVGEGKSDGVRGISRGRKTKVLRL